MRLPAIKGAASRTGRDTAIQSANPRLAERSVVPLRKSQRTRLPQFRPRHSDQPIPLLQRGLVVIVAHIKIVITVDTLIDEPAWDRISHRGMRNRRLLVGTLQNRIPRWS